MDGKNLYGCTTGFTISRKKFQNNNRKRSACYNDGNTLCADIDMKQQPWIGMVLGENAVLMAQIIPSLIYGWIILYFRSRVNIPPNACVGAGCGN